MFLKLGQTYVVSLLVTDINNNRILDDTPITIIKNSQDFKYWNGMSWVDNEFHIIMNHIGNGVYSYNFTPDKIGVFTILSRSDEYNCSKIISLTAYNDDIVKYDWLVNTSYPIKFIGDGDSAKAKIIKLKDNTFWNGTEWVNDIFLIDMNSVEDFYLYNFTPDEISEYSITVFSEIDEIFFILNATDTADNIPPLFVGSNTLKSLDGSDSKVLDEQGSPIPNTQITIFNPTTKEVIAKTITNDVGAWNLMLKPGNYYFMFEKNGYISVGFERMVV